MSTNRLEIAIENYGEIATTPPKYSLGYDSDGYYRKPPKKIIKKGVGIKTIQQLSKWDPSGNNKYLDWILNRKVNTKIQLKTLKDFVTCFHQMPSKFKHSDIYKYQTEKDITTELNDMPNRLSKSEIKASGAIVVAETDQYKIVIPKTHMAAKMYGSGTRWCLTSASPTTFNSYQLGEIIYFCIVKDPTIIKMMNKMGGASDKKNHYNRYHKLAVLLDRYNPSSFTFWDAQDRQLNNTSDLPMIYTVDFYGICRNHYSSHLTSIRLSHRVEEIKAQYIRDLKNKKPPTYNDTIRMLDKILMNLEES